VGPVGTQRSWIVVILLSIVTFGIYAFWWQYAMFKELKDHAGTGLGGGLGLLLAIVTGGISTAVLLPHEVGGLYERTGREAPVSWLTALWLLLPLIGNVVWLVKVQGRTNEYWASAGRT
jgi:hypothetical protein